MKTKTLILFLTILSISVSAAKIKIDLINYNGDSLLTTKIPVMFHGAVSSGGSDSVFYDTVIFHDTVKSTFLSGQPLIKELVHTIGTGTQAWTGTVSVYKKGFSFVLNIGETPTDSFTRSYVNASNTAPSFHCYISEIPPTVSVVNKGATLKNTAIDFQWSAKDTVGIVAQYLYFTFDGNTIIDTVNPIASSFTWTPPSYIGPVQLTVKVFNVDTFATAAYNFTLVDSTTPKVTLTSPVGGETWYTKTLHSITWTATDNIGVTRRILSISLDSGKSWISVSDTTSNTGSFALTLPDTENTSKIKIVVFDAAGNKDSVTSGIFFVKKPILPKPTVTLTSPTGGEIWQTKTNHSITWVAKDSFGIARRILSITLDTGKTWTVISDTTTNTGTFNYTTPIVECGAKIKIVVYNSSGLKDSAVSNIFFIKKPTNILYSSNKSTITHIKIGHTIFSLQGTNYNIKILNLKGSLIGRSLNNNLQSGEYIVQISTPNKMITTKVMIEN